MSFLSDNIRDAYNMNVSFKYLGQEVYISNIQTLVTEYGRRNIWKYTLKPVIPDRLKKSHNLLMNFSDKQAEYEMSKISETMSFDKLSDGIEENMFKYGYIKKQD